MRLVMGREGYETVLLPGDAIYVDLQQGTLMLYRPELPEIRSSRGTPIMIQEDNGTRAFVFHLKLSGMRREDWEAYIRPFIHVVAMTHGYDVVQEPSSEKHVRIFRMFSRIH